MSKLFSILKEIDRGNLNFYNDLTDEEKKKNNLYMLLKWLSHGNNSHRLLLLNSSANRYFFKLSKYPNLTARLLAVSGLGDEESYKWVKSNKKTPSRKKSIEVLMKFYNINLEEAKELIELMDATEVVDMAERLGLHEVVKDVNKDFK